MSSRPAGGRSKRDRDPENDDDLGLDFGSMRIDRDDENVHRTRMPTRPFDQPLAPSAPKSKVDIDMHQWVNVTSPIKMFLVKLQIDRYDKNLRMQIITGGRKTEYIGVNDHDHRSSYIRLRSILSDIVSNVNDEQKKFHLEVFKQWAAFDDKSHINIEFMYHEIGDGVSHSCETLWKRTG